MIDGRMTQNAHKLIFLASVYPEKNVEEIIKLFMIAPIDINCAIWAAIEMGFLEEVDPKVNMFKILKKPTKWDFGTDVEALEASFTYALTKVNHIKEDLEENFISEWTSGYFPQDSLIAVKRLIDKNIVHEYELEDGESKYIFYTLKKNAGKNWGTKQFKVNPLTGEEQKKVAEDSGITKLEEDKEKKE